MPPPPRPNKEDREEKVDVADIGDSLFGSGIDLKAEENYMHTMYHNRHAQGDSFSTNQNTSSFNSSTMSPSNSFNLLTQGTSFGSQDAHANGAFAGTMGQVQSQEDIELEQRRKREVAAKEQAERRQHHLNNQFLLCNNVRKRMDRLALSEGVTLNMQGVFLRQPDTSVMVNGAGSQGIAALNERVAGVRAEARPESVVNQGTPFESVVSLVSLAAGERIRGLLDEAHALARARRYGDHGRVPPEFADIAEGAGAREEEEVVPESVTKTPWDEAPESTQDNGMPNGSNEKSSTPQPRHTIAFQGTLNARLRSLADRDKQAEKARLKKREARKRAAEAAANGETPPAETETPTGPAEAAAPLKLSKKEQLKQQKEKNASTDAQLHTSTNQTAAMMALGKKGSRYSWMTGGAAAIPTNRFAKAGIGNGSGAVTPVTKQEVPSTPGGGVGMSRSGSGSGVGEEGKVKVRELEWGDWREDVEGGIEVRDWVLVLERDGREKVALQRVVNGMVA